MMRAPGPGSFPIPHGRGPRDGATRRVPTSDARRARFRLARDPRYRIGPPGTILTPPPGTLSARTELALPNLAQVFKPLAPLGIA